MSLTLEQKVLQVCAILKETPTKHVRYALQQHENPDQAMDFLLTKTKDEMEKLIKGETPGPTIDEGSVKKIMEIMNVSRERAILALESSNGNADTAVLNLLSTGGGAPSPPKKSVSTPTETPKSTVDDDDEFEDVLDFSAQKEKEIRENEEQRRKNEKDESEKNEDDEKDEDVVIDFGSDSESDEGEDPMLELEKTPKKTPKKSQKEEVKTTPLFKKKKIQPKEIEEERDEKSEELLLEVEESPLVQQQQQQQQPVTPVTPRGQEEVDPNELTFTEKVTRVHEITNALNEHIRFALAESNEDMNLAVNYLIMNNPDKIYQDIQAKKESNAQAPPPPPVDEYVEYRKEDSSSDGESDEKDEKRQEVIDNLMEALGNKFQRKYVDFALEHSGGDENQAFGFLQVRTEQDIETFQRNQRTERDRNRSFPRLPNRPVALLPHQYGYQRGYESPSRPIIKKKTYIPPNTWDQNPEMTLNVDAFRELNGDDEIKNVHDLCDDELFCVLEFCDPKTRSEFLISSREINERLYANNGYYKKFRLDPMGGLKKTAFMSYLKKTEKINHNGGIQHTTYLKEFPQFKELYNISKGRSEYKKIRNENQYEDPRIYMIIGWLVLCFIGFVIETFLVPLTLDDIIPSRHGYYWLISIFPLYIIVPAYFLLFLFNIKDSNYFPIFHSEQRKRTRQENNDVKHDTPVLIQYFILWIFYMIIVAFIKITFFSNLPILSFILIPGYVLMFLPPLQLFIPWALQYPQMWLAVICSTLVYTPLCIAIVLVALKLDGFIPYEVFFSLIFILLYITIIIFNISFFIFVFFISEKDAYILCITTAVTAVISVVVALTILLYGLKLDGVTMLGFWACTLPIYIAFCICIVVLLCALCWGAIYWIVTEYCDW